jgi:hypothetical protein
LFHKVNLPVSNWFKSLIVYEQATKTRPLKLLKTGLSTKFVVPEQYEYFTMFLALSSGFKVQRTISGIRQSVCCGV